MSKLGQDLIAVVRDIAAEKPNYIYHRHQSFTEDNKPVSSCMYVHDGHPSCLLGFAMWSLGVIDESIERSPANVWGFTRGLRWWIHELKELDLAEWDWLGWVQHGQDSARPWGEAVASADDKVSASIGGNEADG